MIDHDPRVDDRAAATAWARGLLERTDWVILDTETCGLYDMAYICEIAVIRPDGSELLNTRVRPAIPIPAAATEIHWITNFQVESALPIQVISGRLDSLLHGVKTIVTYNAEFDRAAMDLSLSTCHSPEDPENILAAEIWGGWTAKWEWECAMLQYAAWIGEWSAQHGRYRYQRLNGGHSALSDCLACLNRIREMAEVGEK